MNSVAELNNIFICSDLDRTLIPNGFQQESVYARPVFRRLAENAHIYLAYVSGRDKQLILDAIEEFYLPMPDYAIGWAAWQLLGKVPEPLQVPNPKLAATFNIGGPICASVCTVLRRAE